MPRTALIVTDVITTYEFEDGEALAESARGAAPRIGALLRRAHDGDVPVVYVNDNAGEWSASRDDLVERMAPRTTRTCSRSCGPGATPPS